MNAPKIAITDDSPIVVPVDEVLEALGHGDSWVQGNWEDGLGGMCLHQGIRVCQQQPGDAYLIEQVACRQGWGPDWNDDEGRTFDDIKSRLVEHREVFPHELEETFGPQWADVCGLVRQAATLTEVQGYRLAIAWAAACNAARDAAWAAACKAAGDAAWAAACDAARAAAGAAACNAARGAARDAARAAVVRDLIGQHGFTQAHFDILVSPWESVMGREFTRGEAS